HIVFEVNKAALPVWQSPKPSPDFEISPHKTLLLFSELGLVHRIASRSKAQDARGPLRRCLCDTGFTTSLWGKRHVAGFQAVHAARKCAGSRRRRGHRRDRKSTRLNSSHYLTSYAVSCFKKQN